MANDRALFTAEVILSVLPDPATPPVGTLCLFPQTDGRLYLKNSNGDVYPVGADVGAGSDVRTPGGALEGQVAVWVDNSTVEGLSGFTYDRTSETLSVPTTGTIALGSNPVVDFRNNRIELRSIGAVDTATATAIKNSLNLSFTDIEGTLSTSQIQGYDASNTTEFLRRDGTFQEISLDIFPPGLVSPYAGSSAPTGWLLCQGQALPTGDYPGLFSAIGYTYGGSGSTFNLPNLQQRVPVGAGSGYPLGATGGSQAHTLTVDEVPSHSHTTQPHSHTVTEPNGGQGHSHELWVWGGSGNDDINDAISGRNTAISGEAEGPFVYSATNGVGDQLVQNSPTEITIDNATVAVGSTGGGQAHNNMQPYTVLNYIIKT